MQNADLDESQAGIKIAGRNINNFRYAGNFRKASKDTIVMTESKEELKTLSMKVKKESEKAVLKLSIQKMNIMASSPFSSCICISEVIDISPGNLDSSLCFFHPRISHDVLCI